jgi:preprotein translocase subunit SecE
MGKVKTFAKECVAELRKVVWPTRDDVLASVKVVVVSTVAVAIVLGLLDVAFTSFMRFVF